MNNPDYFRIDADQAGLIEHVVGAPRAVLNLPCRIDLESEIDEEKVLEAMRLTVTRLPFCTLRLSEFKDGSFKQYYYNGEPEGIELVDMSKKSESKVDDYILKLAGTAFDNNCNDSQLWQFKLIRRAGGKHTIFFKGYHLIMDTYGLMYVITYFDKVYAALINGTELPERGVGPEKQIEKSWEYRGSEKEQRDIEWWKAQLETEPHFADMNPGTSKEYVKGKNYGKPLTLLQMRAVSMPMRIPSELVHRVNDAALNANLSPQLYYFLAVRTFLAHNSGSSDVTVGTTGARRATLWAKHCGMTMAHMVMWRTEIDGSLSFSDALKQLDFSQKNIYKHVSVYMDDVLRDANVRFGAPENALYWSMVYTYQPYFSVENVNLKFSAEHVNVGVTPYPLYMNVMPRDGSGDLWADYIYGNGYLKPENIQKFHAFMLRFVEAGLTSPEKSVKELSEASL
ncbi:MAG: hypothetical protein IJS90_01975 [Clostridia bacterium]|nr:hypothetical protein [Clostridia bacterium]